MDELESAVLLSLEPSVDQSLRDRALQYCQNIKQSLNGWAFVLQRLSISMRPEVSFFCLEVIRETLSSPDRYPALFSAEEVVAVRTKLLEFFSYIVYPERFTEVTANAERRFFPTFLLNKAAQVVVALIAADYPHRWQQAFQETVLPLLTNGQATDASITMFFRVLRSLDDEVTSIRASQVGEGPRKTSIRVKDAMRDDCIVEIVARCTNYLASSKYKSLAFDIFARYVEWVDIGLVAKEQILSPMYATITSTEWSDARPAAAAALRAIVMKRMDSEAKVNLLKALRIETLLQTIPVNEIIVHENEGGYPGVNVQTGQVEVAALVNTVAVVALDILKDAWKENKQIAVSQGVSEYSGRVAQTALPVALRFLHENADEETSSQTLQCVTTYVNVFSRAAKSNQNGISGEGIAAVAAILKVIEERSIFAENFDPLDDQSDNQGEFLELRSVLLKNVFRSVVQSFPDLCLDFVKTLLSQASESGDVPKTELGLSMFLIVHTTYPEMLSVVQLRRDVILHPPACMGFITDLATSLLSKQQLAQKNQMELISSTYFDLVARSYKMFLIKDDPTLLSAVLPVFFDRRGLGHGSSEAVRSHAAYSLLKLTRPLRSVITNNQLDAILNAVRVHLFPLHPDISAQKFKNQMMIFETVGYLLGTDHKREASMQYLTAILRPLVEGLQSHIGPQAVPYISAAGFLSKGFGGDSKPLLLLNELRQDRSPDSFGKPSANGNSDNSSKDVKVQRVMPLTGDMQVIWVSCLEAVLKASAPGFKQGDSASVTELRSKSLFFLHRMVDTIGVPVLSYLERILPDILELAAASPVQLRDVVILVSQAVTKFGDASENMVMCVYAPIVQYVHQHSYSLDPKSLMAISEEGREAVEMHRAYTYFLHAIVGTKLIRILIHPKHISLARTVMMSLLSSAVGESLDIRVSSSVMKMCLHMLGLMVQKWVSGQEGAMQGPPGFREFALKEISKTTAMCGIRGSIFRSGDYSSGQAVGVLSEIVTLQRTCAAHLGMEFGEFLRGGTWSDLPKQDVQLYLSALYSTDAAAAHLVPALATLCRMARSR